MFIVGWLTGVVRLQAACSEGVTYVQWSKFEGRNGLPGDVNGELLLETSQFIWWIDQIFLATLYLESPLDLLLLESLSPATIFRFLIPWWPGARISPDRGRKSLAS